MFNKEIIDVNATRDGIDLERARELVETRFLEASVEEICGAVRVTIDDLAPELAGLSAFDCYSRIFKDFGRVRNEVNINLIEEIKRDGQGMSEQARESLFMINLKTPMRILGAYRNDPEIPSFDEMVHAVVSELYSKIDEIYISETIPVSQQLHQITHRLIQDRKSDLFKIPTSLVRAGCHREVINAADNFLETNPFVVNKEKLEDFAERLARQLNVSTLAVKQYFRSRIESYAQEFEEDPEEVVHSGDILKELGDVVDFLIGLAILHPGGYGSQSFFHQFPEDGIDLPIALTPEMADGCFDELLDVVARLRTKAQHAKQSVTRIV